MPNECQHCRHQNPGRARFCGRCGQGLTAQSSESLNPLPGPRPRARSKRCCGPSGFLFLLCLGAIGVCWIGKQGPHRSISWSGRSQQVLSLDPVKAKALFNLLSPDDVSVMVGPVQHRRFIGGGNVSVSGTSEEVRTVRQFAELLTRIADDPWFRDGELIDSPFAETPEHTYRLTRSRAKALAEMLSSEGAPVFVTRIGSRLSVIATPEDQRTIADVVRLLGGRQSD